MPIGGPGSALWDPQQMPVTSADNTPAPPTDVPGVTGTMAAAPQPPPPVGSLPTTGALSQPPAPVIPPPVTQTPVSDQEQGQLGLPPPYQGPAQRGGAVKNALTRMLYGMGQAGLQHVGLPTDYEIQQNQYAQALKAGQLQVEQAHQRMLQQAQQYQQTLLPITTPEGYTIYAPPGAQGTIQAAIQRRYGTETAAETAATSREKVAQLQYGPNLPLDPTLANLAGIPEMAGKPVGIGTLKAINTSLAARGIKTTDLGSQGVWLTDRGGNRLNYLGQSPRIGAAYAGAEARAATTPYEAVDNDGNPITISNLQAVTTGVPGIGKPNLAQTLQPAALIGDIRGGLKQVRGLTGVLDDPAERVKIAATLASPTSTLAQLAQSGVLDSLSPRGQDYVIAMMNLKENAMAMRTVLKAGQGSEDVRAAIQRTIPSASTPGSDYANRQIDLVGNTLDRVEKGIVNLPGTRKALGAGGGNRPSLQSFEG